MSRYIEWIKGQIAEHEKSIAKLTIARDVYFAAEKAMGAPKSHHAKVPTKRKMAGKNTRNYILATMGQMELPASPGDISAAVRSAHPELTPKVIWNCMYNARIKGAVIRTERGMYTLPPKPEEAAA